MVESEGGTADPRALRLRYPATCKACGAAVPKGAEAWWWASEKQVECQACRPESADGAVHGAREVAGGSGAGTAPMDTPANDAAAQAPATSAGASARREYDRRAARERARQEAAIERDAQRRAARREARPVLGRVVNALAERPPDPKESQSTRAWKIGAAGERRVAQILDATACVVLHDRRIPGSRANIDHLAVGPAGVFVIDAKKYEGKQLEIRDKGTFFSPDPRLYVGGRDQTKLVTGVKRQVEVVRSVLDGADVPVHAVLCFVGAHWPGLFSNKPQRVSGATATYPTALAKLVAQEGPITPERMREIGERLAAQLSPA